VCDLCEVDGLRAFSGVECVVAGAAVPINVRIGLHESHSEGFGCVFEEATLLRSEPVDLERDCPMRRRISVEQTVGNVSVVSDREIRDLKLGRGVIDARTYRVVRDGDRPEQPLAGTTAYNPGVVVVDLGFECRVNLTRVDVQSDESECSAMPLSVGTDVLAFHEAIVGTEMGAMEWMVVVHSGSGPADVGHSHQPFEVKDRRNVGVGRGRKEMKFLAADNRAVWDGTGHR